MIIPCTGGMWTQYSSRDGAISVCLPFLSAHVQTVALGLPLAREESVWMALASRHVEQRCVCDLCRHM